jgi:hypothetical protein
MCTATPGALDPVEAIERAHIHELPAGFGGVRLCCPGCPCPMHGGCEVFSSEADEEHGTAQP